MRSAKGQYLVVDDEEFEANLKAPQAGAFRRV
jgi:hypothetical protein